MNRKVMVSPVAGKWYSGHEGSLRRSIEELREGLMVARRRHVCAAVVPHAGYRYSGSVAVGVYQRIDARSYDRVLVLGPSHYRALKNKISIPDATHYKTPLGVINADLDFIEKLRKLPFITTEPDAHVSEHSDQIQLPLIQVCLGMRLPVVCMVSGQFGAKTIMKDAAKLRSILDDKTLLVVSSDFTHCGESYGFVPSNRDARKNIEVLDNGIFELFMRKDVEGFIKKLNESGATVCGRDPLALLLAMMPADAKVRQTAYATSAKAPPDERNAASYIGAIVTGRWSEVVKAEQVIGDKEPLSHQAGKVLLALARNVIDKALESGEKNVGFLQEQPRQFPREITALRGGFVTLKRDGKPRGCIGEIFPSREIWKVVREHAYNAAFTDPRFSPLEEFELDDLEIEVSVLSQPRPIESPEQIVIGKHGVVLSKSGLNAVFLPQVAPEQGWGLHKMLAHLSVKAGLPPDAWRAGATFLVFEAQIFS